MTALLLLHFLLCLRSGDFFFIFFFYILWINAEFKKKQNLFV